MRVLIVHAHPEPQSFNGAMTAVAAAALENAGHPVVVSDLYRMRFDPVSDRRNFTSVANPARLKLQDEEAHASAHDGFAPDLQAEMDKVAWCDALVLQFPLWWLGPPAILKGWIDRVFALGRAYGGGHYFSKGRFAGKRAMCSITIGGSRDAYSERGAYGPVEAMLFPIQHGVLAFTGFDVVEPFVVHAPSRLAPPERSAILDDYGRRVVGLEDAGAKRPTDMSAFDGLVLKPRHAGV